MQSRSTAAATAYRYAGLLPVVVFSVSDSPTGSFRFPPAHGAIEVYACTYTPRRLHYYYAVPVVVRTDACTYYVANNCRLSSLRSPSVCLFSRGDENVRTERPCARQGCASIVPPIRRRLTRTSRKLLILPLSGPLVGNFHFGVSRKPSGKIRKTGKNKNSGARARSVREYRYVLRTRCRGNENLTRFK